MLKGAAHGTLERTNEMQSIRLLHKNFISSEPRIMAMNHLFHVRTGNSEHEHSKQRKEVKNPKEARVGEEMHRLTTAASARAGRCRVEQHADVR